MTLHVAVVGGGPAGLAAAAYLARTGARVTVFEKSAALGGRSATDDLHGFRFNRGGHALYPGGAASQVLAELGVRYRYGTPSATAVAYGGACYPLANTPTALLRSSLLSLRDKLALVRLLATVPRLDARSLARTSVQQWLDQSSPRPMVRRLVAGLARTVTYSTAFDLISAELVISRLQQTLRGPVHYVEGGWQTLVDGLERAARSAGAQLRRGTAVVAIEPTSSRGVIVRTRDGAPLPVESVVVATPPAEAARLLPALDEVVAALVPAEVACLDVGLGVLPVPTRPVVLDLDAPRFVTAQSVYARGLAPAGGAMVHVMKYLDARQPTQAEQDEHELEAALDLAQPGWRTLLMQRRLLPRMQAAGALPLAAHGGLAGRPGPHVAGLPTVFLAGDWIGPAGYLLDTSLASGREAARLAGAGIDGLRAAA